FGHPPAATTTTTHPRPSSGTVTMGKIILSPRAIDDAEGSVWVEQVSHGDKRLWEHAEDGIRESGSRKKYRKQREKRAK
ncbi:hypothetical protein ACC738_38940, partial [Rhizobium ruizarguesonis]